MHTLITKQEAAAIFRVSVWTLRNWRASGVLVEGVHYFQFTRFTLRYSKEAIEQLMASKNINNNAS
jgi:hypothetical protein